MQLLQYLHQVQLLLRARVSRSFCFLTGGVSVDEQSTVTIFKRQWADLSVTRKGRDTTEYLIQRLFIMDSNLDKQVFFLEPTALINKAASSHMNAYLKLLPTARKMGHDNVMVGFFCWDRAVPQSCERLVRQYFEGVYEHDKAMFLPGKAHRLYLLAKTVKGELPLLPVFHCTQDGVARAFRSQRLDSVENRCPSPECIGTSGPTSCRHGGIA